MEPSKNYQERIGWNFVMTEFYVVFGVLHTARLLSGTFLNRKGDAFYIVFVFLVCDSEMEKFAYKQCRDSDVFLANRWCGLGSVMEEQALPHQVKGTNTTEYERMV